MDSKLGYPSIVLLGTVFQNKFLLPALKSSLLPIFSSTAKAFSFNVHNFVVTNRQTVIVGFFNPEKGYDVTCIMKKIHLLSSHGNMGVFITTSYLTEPLKVYLSK